MARLSGQVMPLKSGSEGARFRAFSLISTRLTELATCELLLLENYPWWTPILPLYTLSSYIVDASIPIFKPIRGLTRRIRSIISRSFGLRLFVLRPFDTHRLYVDLDSIYLIASEYMKGETARLLTPGDKVVLDLGAHYGLVSAKMAMFSRSSKVFAIEAHPSNYKVLKSNLAVNHLTNVIAFNFAVAGFTGTTSMMGHDGISARYSLAKTYEGSDLSSTVRCYGLADILTMLDIDYVDVVKMDIEGLELEVLQSSLPTLSNRIGKLDIEVHKSQDLTPLLELLKSNGYAAQATRAGIISWSTRILAEKESK